MEEIIRRHMVFKKYVLSFYLPLLLCISAYGQEMSYSRLEEMERQWSKSFLLDDKDDEVINKTKTVDFQTNHYSISAVFLKGKIASGHKVVILDTNNNYRPILEGVASYDQDFLVITGLKYDYSAVRFTTTYGSFLVFNADDGLMVYKPKKAGDIRIVEHKLFYHNAYCHNYPVIVSLFVPSYIAVDGKKGGAQFTDYLAPISQPTLKRIGYNKPIELLMDCKKDVRIKWRNGVVFSGEVLPVLNEKDGFSFYPLAGKMKGYSNGYKERKLFKEHGSICMELLDSPENPVMKRETLIVFEIESIPEKDYWNENVFMENVDEVVCEYRNGDVFKGHAFYKPLLNAAGELVSSDVVFKDGVVQYANGDKFEGRFDDNGPKEGVYYYVNGDRFEGSLKNKWGNLFFDGTTYLRNGSSINGNYLSICSFTESQCERLKNCKSPSEAMAMASAFTNSKKYEVYANESPWNYFFDAKLGYISFWGYGRYVVFRKDRKCYYFLRDDLSINMVIYTDVEGRHLKEVVYKGGTPDYTTLYTYYSNFMVSSIETRWLNGEKILKGNFFSDGEVRSAYEYQKGNGGKMVLRYSREAHPIYGGYISKIYDLNGNYERTIEWWKGIGSIEIAPKIKICELPLDPIDSKCQDIIHLIEGHGL